MATMKAVILPRIGGPEVLVVSQDQPKPIRAPGEVLVKIDATSVNPIDYKTRKADPMPKLIIKLPKILGCDLAGTVVESDEGSKFAPGAKVFALTDGFKFGNPHGTYAEFFSAKEEHLALAPRNATPAEAAAIPLAALTAWQALDKAALKPGQRILIHAGAGGVGHMAVQLAKVRGLHVTTTCSTRNVEFVKSLGADEAVDYTTQKFEDICEPFDGVIDLIGGDVERRSLSKKALKRSGTFVSVLNSGTTGFSLVKGLLSSALRLGPRYHVVFAASSGRQLAEVASLVDSGKVRVEIDRVLPLEEAAEAQRYLEQGHARGKVVLAVTAAGAAQK